MSDDITKASEVARLIQSTREVILRYRFQFSDEAELQEGLSQVLGKGWKREHQLSEEDRVNFFHAESGVVIETKINHGLTPLTRQVHRYLQHDVVTGLLVVTSRMGLSKMPDRISGKPVGVATIIGSML